MTPERAFRLSFSDLLATRPPHRHPETIEKERDCATDRRLWLSAIPDRDRWLAGLAVHQQFTVFGSDEWCVLDPQSPFFPTVIPWPKLKP